MILVDASFAQQSSGDGMNSHVDQEDDTNETLICINPYNSSAANHRNDADAIETTEINYTDENDAIMHGQCLSACLGEMMANENVTFESSYNNKLHYQIFYPLYEQPLLMDQISLCSKGCLIKHTTTNNTTETCSNVCVQTCNNVHTSSDNFCDRYFCLQGCQLKLPQLNDSASIVFPPSLSPLNTIKTNSLGVYNITFDRIEEDPGSSGQQLLQPTSASTIFTLIIKIIGKFNGKTTTNFINKAGLITSIDLREYICYSVEISFAWVSEHGNMSEYSSSVNLTVDGVLVGQPLPVTAISYQQSYDFRLGYYGHNELNVTWQNPPDANYISHYELHIQQVHPCGSAIEYIYPPFGVITSFNFRASSPAGPPICNCAYDIRIVSIPFSSVFEKVANSKLVHITTPPDDVIIPPSINCTKFLNDQFMFTIVVTVTITEYQAFENIFDELIIIPSTTEFNQNGQRSNNFGSQIKFYIEPNASSWIYNVTQNFVPKPTANFEYNLHINLHFPDNMLYKPPLATETCTINALSPRPDNITELTLIQFAKRSLFSIYLSFSWEPPLSLNGRFTTYQMRLVPESYLSIEEIQQNQFPYLTTQNSTTFCEWNPSYIPDDNIRCLYLQIRANNEYRAGIWSDPVTIPVHDDCIDDDNDITITPTDTISLVATGTPTVTPAAVQTLSTALSLSITAIVLIVSIAVVIVAIFCIHFHLRRRKRRLELIQETTFRDPIFDQLGPRMVFPITPIQPNDLVHDAWEISANQVIIECGLSEGAFGEVYKGIIGDGPCNPKVRSALKESRVVAIKLLKTSATGSERSDFLKEIELMKKISEGSNPHVVNMIGCVTAQEPLCLITEFVVHGDLLSYLRSTRKMISEGTDNNQYPDLEELQSNDLISFAYQIASGMEFLSSLQIVHRDLACRNVLVTETKTLKITDFGMSRMVEAGDIYIKTTRARLPLKWMAIESITDREFTSASDVWSYGITLWEIGTLGGFPYPTINNDELLMRLKQGYRMDCPENCSKEIYEIMLECWHENPLKRPPFTLLRDKFDTLLSTCHGNAYIDLHTDEQNVIYSIEEEEEQVEETAVESQCSPAISKRSHSPSCVSTTSSTNVISVPATLSVTNPWIRDNHSLSPSSQRHSSANLSPHSSHGNMFRPQRPISLSLWAEGEGPKEDYYADDPSALPTT
jgi:serine/threonine protein kinase